MRIYPASHYTMGGLWVDYELQTTIPGLFAAGEANFSDHGANRLGASALMQGLSDGYFVLPYTIAPYLSGLLNKPIPDETHEAFGVAEQEARSRYQGYLDIGGTKTPDHFHRQLGKIIWDYCGMDRNRVGLEKALSEIPALHAEFKQDLRVTGDGHSLNQTLEKAARVDDFFELGLLMCKDALVREESCGGHFRSEYQTDDGEALRNDDDFAHVTACLILDPTAPATGAQAEQAWRHRRPTHPPNDSLEGDDNHHEQHPHEHHAEDLASGRARRTGSLRDPPDPRDQRRGIVPRDARHPERTADRGEP
jgi:succinate dehydrogenase / fumarate reductase flavoprotein subunit